MVDPSNEVTVVVRPWYRQFYVQRGAAEWRSDQVSVDGYERGLEAIGGFLFVGTTMYGSPTRVTVRVHPENPGVSQAADRSADDTLAGEGSIAVLNWEPGEPPVAEVVVQDGVLGVRASWYGTADAASHPDFDLGGDDPSPESIILDVWPTAERALRRAP
jgi:hypothetical protein